MIYVLYGADDFSRDGRLREIKQGLGPQELVEVNTALLEGQRLSFSELEMACNAAPFLAEKRVVVVEELFSRFQWRGQRGGRRPGIADQGRDEAEWRPLKAFLGGMSLTTVLVFVDGPLAAGNPLLREVAPLATVAEFPLLRREKLQGWIRDQATILGATLSPEAVRALEDLIGGNLRLLHSELEKLALYAAGRSILASDVARLVSGAREATVFVLVDAIIEGRPAQATRFAHQLQNQGERVPSLLAMLTRQVRLMLQAKELISLGVEEDELTARLGLTSSFVLQKTREQSNRYTLQQMKQLYQKLLQVDLNIKTGRLEEWLALDMLAAESRAFRG